MMISPAGIRWGDPLTRWHFENLRYEYQHTYPGTTRLFGVLCAFLIAVTFATILLAPTALQLQQPQWNDYYKVSFMLNAFAFGAYVIAFAFLLGSEHIISDIAYDLERVSKYLDLSADKPPAAQSIAQPLAPADAQALPSVVYAGVLHKRHALDTCIAVVLLFGGAIGLTLLMSIIVLVAHFHVGGIMDGSGYSIAILVVLTIGGLFAFFVVAALPPGLAKGARRFTAQSRVAALDNDPFFEARSGFSRVLRFILAGLPMQIIAASSRRSADKRWNARAAQ